MHINTIVLSAVILGSVFTTAARADLIQNGGFSSTYTGDTQFGTAYSQANQQGVTGGTGNNGYDIWFVNAATATSQAGNTTGQHTSDGREYLWAAASSPGGGSFIGLDGDTTIGVQGMISQSISGLTIGQQYVLSFDWAGAQIVSRTGDTTDQIQASLGDQSFTTAVVRNASQGFTGWMNQTFTFNATSPNETLSFLSIGGPSGLEPMALLDDVSLNAVAVPEPMSLTLLGTGLVGISMARRRKTG